MEQPNEQNQKAKESRKRQVLGNLLFNIVGIVLALTFIYSIIFPLVKDLYYVILDIKSFNNNPLKYLAKMDITEGGWKLVLLGFGVFLLKKFQQFWFGVLEFAFTIFYSVVHYKIVQEQAINNDLKIEVIISMITIVFLSANSIANMYDGSKLDFVGKKLIFDE